jgi:hypothetical protein
MATGTLVPFFSVGFSVDLPVSPNLLLRQHNLLSCYDSYGSIGKGSVYISIGCYVVCGVCICLRWATGSFVNV